MSEKAAVTYAQNGPEVKVAGIDLAEAARRAWLAGLGAVAVAQDEIVALVHKMIERGAVTEQEGREWFEKTRGKAMKMPQKSWKSAESELDHQLDALLDWLGVPTKADLQRMDLPTRADIEALAEKVAALTKKVEQLRKAEEQPAHKPEKAVKAEVKHAEPA
jgi:poly(hydroxyalkanoate) granule-associated protein